MKRSVQNYPWLAMIPIAWIVIMALSPVASLAARRHTTPKRTTPSKPAATATQSSMQTSTGTAAVAMPTTTSATTTMATAATPPIGDQPGSYERAYVDKVIITGKSAAAGGQQIEIYRVHFLSGPFIGKQRDISNEVGANPYGLQPREGDTVVVFLQPSPDGGVNFFLESYDRRLSLFILALLFIFTLVLLAGWQGFKVALSMMISIALIAYVLIPLFLQGVNPVPIAILLAGALTLISTTLTTGWNKKSWVTAIGTMGGTLVGYAISAIFAHWAHLSGLSTEDDRLFFDKNPALSPQGLLFAGIIIASLGVVEDVAVSIASGVSEVKRANPKANFRQLFAAGMVVGKDHMGALANTLVFAYVGGALSTLLLYKEFGGSWLKFINFDSVVDEIIRSLSGTIGLVFTVPITALLAAWVMQQLKSNQLPPSDHQHQPQ